MSCVVPSIVGDDVEGCADLLRPMYALYIGGMGARDVNFHFDVFSRLGYEGACHDIQDAYLDGRKADAIAKVADRAHRGRRPHRSGGQDRRGPRAVAGDLPHHDARLRARRSCSSRSLTSSGRAAAATLVRPWSSP